VNQIPYGHQWINDSDVAAVAEALRSDWLTTGPRVTQFEDAIAVVAGSDGAVAVSSGTAALHAAYAAAGVGAGDEVIVPALTFVATAAAAIHQGATVRFADVQEDTGNIDPASAASLISKATRVIAGVDYAGHPVDADEIATLARDAGALFLEDAAHSIGSTYHGRSVGSLADLTTFSFFPTKNMTTAEGGAVVSRDSVLLERARNFRGQGLVRDPALQRYPEEGPWHQEVHELGLNYRLPDALCALGLTQIARLETFKAGRKRVFDRYHEGLVGVEGVRLPTRGDHVDPMWHLYPIRVAADRRRRLFEHLRTHGVMVQVNYLPVYWHPWFEDHGYRRGMCPVAEQYYREEISLPMYANLSEGDQDRVVDLVRSGLE